MYKENVERGIEWLDNNHEGWREKVDLNILNTLDGESCVLAQLFNKEYQFICNNYEDEFLIDNGFNINYLRDGFNHNDREIEHKELTAEWKKQLTS